MRGWFGGLRSKTLSPFSTACHATHSTQKHTPLSMLCTYGEHTSPPAHPLNLICIGKLLIINRGPHRKHFRWGKHSHPMLTRFFCLYELRMQIRCRKSYLFTPPERRFSKADRKAATASSGALSGTERTARSMGQMSVPAR